MNDNLIPKQDEKMVGGEAGQNQINNLGSHEQSGLASDLNNGSSVVLPAAMPVVEHKDASAAETTPAFIGMNTSSSRIAPQHIPVTPVKSAAPIESSPKPASDYSAIKPNPSVTSTTFANSTPSVSSFTPVSHTNVHSSTTPHSIAKVMWTVISVFILLILAGLGYYYYSISSLSAPEDIVEDTGRSAFPSAVTSNPIQNRPVSTSTAQPSRVPTARELFNAYIKQNISSLSPVKSTSPFTIASIRFDGVNRAIVTYTDGRSTYNAAVNYSVNGSNIAVTDFTLLTK